MHKSVVCRYIHLLVQQVVFSLFCIRCCCNERELNPILYKTSCLTDVTLWCEGYVTVSRVFRFDYTTNSTLTHYYNNTSRRFYHTDSLLNVCACVCSVVRCCAHGIRQMTDDLASYSYRSASKSLAIAFASILSRSRSSHLLSHISHL